MFQRTIPRGSLGKILIKNKPAIILAALIVAYILFTFSLCWFKYHTFNYDGLDLAIFNQVFYNSSQGRWFAASIHPPSFLGDHFEPMIILLLPWYLLWRSPLMLLLLQSVVLGLCAWPVYLLSSRVLKKKVWGLFFACLFLFNPLTWNINLFEFHLMPVALGCLLWAVYCYYRRSFLLFIACCFLALLVREDIPLIVVMFGFLALLDKRRWQWCVVPVAMSIGWFILANQVIAHYSPGGSYKFLVYYSWLGGDNFVAAAKTYLLHPVKVFWHLISWGNLELIVGLFIAWLFLPLRAPRYLLLAALTFSQFVLGASGGGALIWQTHYGALFLPALIPAAIFGWQKLSAWRERIKTKPIKQQNFFELIALDKFLLPIIVALAVVFNFWAFGPVWGLVQEIAAYRDKSSLVALKWDMVRQIPANTGVAATAEFLPALSNRQHLAAWQYVYLGRQQFGLRAYSLPPEINYFLLDGQEVLQYHRQLAESKSFAAYYPEAPANFRLLLAREQFGLTAVSANVILYQRGRPDREQLVKLSSVDSSVNQPPALGSEPAIRITAGEGQVTSGSFGPMLGLNLTVEKFQEAAKEYQLKLDLKQKGPAIYLPFAYGVYTAKDLPLAKPLSLTYQWLLPQDFSAREVEVSLVQLSAQVELSPLRRTYFHVLREQVIGEPSKIILQ